MKEFSWYTDNKPSISTYINGAPKRRYLVVDGIAVIGCAVARYKPNFKGGHTHNHVKNAHKRMEKRMHKCHSCGELFPKGIRHFVCNSCVEEAKIEAALDMYAKFNGIIRNQ